MKRKNALHMILSFALTVSALTAVLILSACASRYEYTDCVSPLRQSSDQEKYFYRPYERTFNFGRIAEAGGRSFYYEKGTDGRKVDHAIDSVMRVQDFCDIPDRVYITENTVTHVNSDGLWVDPNDGVELIGAVLLEHAAQERLPFGIFAGASAYLLGDDAEFSVLSEKILGDRLKDLAYVKELQYPLYTHTQPVKERETAWSFAYRLGEAWFSAHIAEELLTATAETLAPAIEAVGAVLPGYYFPVGDDCYPTQVVTDELHYYFAYNYEDGDFHEDLLEYPVLTAFVLENERLIDETAPLFGLNGFSERIDVFFGTRGEFGLATSGFSDMRRNCIACYSAGIVGHEILHHIAYRGGSDGYFNETICSYFGIKYSYYARYREYLDYTLQTENRGVVYPEETIAFLKQARELYNRTFGKRSEKDFDAEAWLQCGTYLLNRGSERPTLTVLAQGITFVQYVYEKYGFDALMELDRNYRAAEIAGKPYSEIEKEWANYIEQKFRV